MNSPHPKTKMTYNVFSSLMYIVVYIQVPSLEVCSLVAGLVATAIVLLLRNAVEVDISFKRCRMRSQMFSEAEVGALGRKDEVSVAWRRVTRTVGISSSLYIYWYSSRSLSFEALRCTAI